MPLPDRTFPSIRYAAASVIRYIRMELATIFCTSAPLSPQLCRRILICPFKVHINNLAVLYHINNLPALNRCNAPQQSFQVKPEGIVDHC
jgi:hypothetical protein